MLNVTWWRFNQSTKQLILGHTTNYFDHLIHCRSTRSSMMTRRPIRRRHRTSRVSATSACGRSTSAAARRHSTGRTRAARESRALRTGSRDPTPRCRRRPRRVATWKATELDGGGDDCCFWLTRWGNWTSRWQTNLRTSSACKAVSKFFEVAPNGAATAKTTGCQGQWSK